MHGVHGRLSFTQIFYGLLAILLLSQQLLGKASVLHVSMLILDSQYLLVDVTRRPLSVSPSLLVQEIRRQLRLHHRLVPCKCLVAIECRVPALHALNVLVLIQASHSKSCGTSVPVLSWRTTQFDVV